MVGANSANKMNHARIVIEHIMPYRIVVYDDKGKVVEEYPAHSRWGADRIVEQIKNHPKMKHLTVTSENKR